MCRKQALVLEDCSTTESSCIQSDFYKLVQLIQSQSVCTYYLEDIVDIQGCLELVDWTTGLEYWTGILEWPKLL